MFWPRPPKVILATPMATTAPMNTTHQGVVYGRFRPRRIPVTTAERSHKVEGFFSRKRVMAHSSRRQEHTLTAITRISFQP